LEVSGFNPHWSPAERCVGTILNTLTVRPLPSTELPLLDFAVLTVYSMELWEGGAVGEEPRGPRLLCSFRVLLTQVLCALKPTFFALSTSDSFMVLLPQPMTS
jgi:hypothetical protein